MCSVCMLNQREKVKEKKTENYEQRRRVPLKFMTVHLQLMVFSTHIAELISNFIILNNFTEYVNGERKRASKGELANAYKFN